MGKTSLDFLFTDKKAFKPTRDWAELIRSGKDKYANCRVVSFTRVKNLDSKWKHEYLQFIVEEETGKERARVYAERGNEKDLDWVTVGPAETTETGSRSDDDLPLPLASLIFGGKSGQDVTQRPTVLEIAEILAATTVIGGAYEFYGHSCFWYAYTAYDAIKRQFGKFATEKAWRWLDIGGAGNAGVKDAIGLGWPFLFKFYYVVSMLYNTGSKLLLSLMQGDAKKFKEERETNMAFFGDERRQIVDANDIVNQVASNLNTDGYRSTYIDALRAQGIELSEVEVSLIVWASDRG